MNTKCVENWEGTLSLNKGVNIYLALAMGAMLSVGPVLPDIPIFQDKPKKIWF
jgi:hypothetical protein